jgi:CRISPR-associated protein Cmr2
MNNSNFWLLKINALLHDPPNKPFNIKSHEGTAQTLSQLLNLSLYKHDFKQADWIASAADRLNFPGYYHIGGADFRIKPYLTHPLSGVRLNLGGGKLLPKDIDQTQLTEAIKQSLIFIKPEIKQDPQKLFLWLWRNWSSQIQQTEGNQLGALWDLLPADTRIPDHSIWAHQALTSAIAATNSNPAFLLFTIGPVQAFISAARRTQDLWAGSYLLSYLNWAAIELIAEEIGPDAVIFPNLIGQPLCDRWLYNRGILLQRPKLEDLVLPSLPNRFLAIVPYEQGEYLAKKAADRMRSQWREITQQVREHIESLFNEPLDWSKTWQRQTENLFNTYWQIYPWRPTGKEPIQDNHFSAFLNPHKPYLGSRIAEIEKILRIYRDDQGTYRPNIGSIYSDIYFITEKALGSRKSLRDFSQVNETGEKSTLGGDRATLYPGIDNQYSIEGDFDRIGRAKIRDFWKELSSKLKPLDIQDTGQERLDAIELTKRLAWRTYFQRELELSTEVDVKNEEKQELKIQLKFPSTSMIATASFKNQIIDFFREGINVEPVRDHLSKWLNEVYKPPLITGNEITEKAIPYLATKLNESILSSSNIELLTSFVRLDGRLLFEDTYEEELNKPINKSHKKLDKIQIRSALNALKEFLKVAKEYGLPKPRKYFAVLMMDGDEMGKWLAGDKMPEYSQVLHPTTKKQLEAREDWQGILTTKRLMSPAIHGFISKALGDFSLKLVRYIVEKENPGKLVYAGGDDVLALLPLDSVLKVARELRAAFSGEIFTGELGTDKECQEFEVKFNDQKTKSGYIWIENTKGDKSSRQLLATMGHKATASTGIVISHYKNPLDVTLTEVRKAEKAAKSQEGRNAFSLTFMKRSGEIMSAGAKWFYADKTLDTVGLLLEFQNKFAEDYISSKFPYILRTEAEVLATLTNNELYTAEIRRLLNRQQGKKQLCPKLAHELSEQFSNLVTFANLHQFAKAIILLFSIPLFTNEQLKLKYQVLKIIVACKLPNKLKTFADLLIFTRFLATGEGEED